MMAGLTTSPATTTLVTTTRTKSSEPRQPALPTLPALVAGRVTHHRTGRVRHAFRYSIYQWLVDLDALPEQPWYLAPFARFSAADHLGDPGTPTAQSSRTSSTTCLSTASSSAGRA